MKQFFIIPMLFLFSYACQNQAGQTVVLTPQEIGRDTVASLQGAIKAAQAQYQTSCLTAPTQPVCVNINKAVNAQNALVTSLEAYCGFSPGTSVTDVSACIPVASAQAGLIAATSNAQVFITQLKGVIQ